MTNWFEQYYPELLRHAVSLVFSKDISADPGDLVNEAYIKWVDSGEEFDLLQVKKYIQAESYKYVNEKLAKRNEGGRPAGIDGWKEYSFKEKKITGDRGCSKCHDPKPVNAFYLCKYDRYTYLSTICKECHCKNTKAWFKREKNHWNAYMRGWMRKKGITKRTRQEQGIRARSLESLEVRLHRASKKWHDKNKENLTDAYIRKNIRHKFKNGHVPKEAIEQRRQELFRKRRENPNFRTNQKYATQEEAAEAKRIQSRERRERLKLNPDFLAEEATKKRAKYQSKKAA